MGTRNPPDVSIATLSVPSEKTTLAEFASMGSTMPVSSTVLGIDPADTPNVAVKEPSSFTTQRPERQVAPFHGAMNGKGLPFTLLSS